MTLVFASAVVEPRPSSIKQRASLKLPRQTVRTSVVILIVVLGVGIIAFFGYRLLARELAWRTDKATGLGELAQAERNRKTAETFRHYPTEPGAEWATTHLEKDVNEMAEVMVIDAKQRLLWLYKDRGKSLSAEEAAQAARWQQDIAAWNAAETKKGEEAAKLRH